MNLLPLAQRIAAEAHKLNLPIQFIAADAERVEIASLSTTLATYARTICEYLAQ